MKFNAELVNESPTLGSGFYEVYDIVKPNVRFSTMTEQLLAIVLQGKNRNECKCDDVPYISLHNKTNLQANLNHLLVRNGYLKFGFGLENYTESGKCFDYWINNSISWNGEFINSLNDLSVLFLKKEIELLDTTEILRLIAWHDVLLKGRNREVEVEERFVVLKKVFDRNK